MNNLNFKIALVIFLIFLLLPFASLGQNETNNWYFGDNSGIDFNYGQFSLLNDGNMSTPAGCSSISNSNGELLFYTNGNKVWNSIHEIMPNGSDLNAEVENIQSSIIIPDTTNPNIYYILTTRTSETNGGIYYSRVEFDNNNPLGIVTASNVRITYNSTERLTAIHSPETNSIKVVGLGTSDSADGPVINKFYVINVGENGNSPQTTPVLVNTEVVERTFYSNSSSMKFSPNGEYIAIGDDGNGYSGVYVYTFDNLNNTLSPYKIINAGYLFMPIPVYGLEFSADSEMIYFSGNYNNVGYLHSYFLNNNDDLAQKALIDFSQEFLFGSLQLASNSKIYMANFTSNEPYFFNKLSVINSPEEFVNIDYEPLRITLDPNNSTKGLPNFISSYFQNRILTENRCVTDTFEFSLDAYDTIDSVLWEFGDANTSTELNPSHQYSLAGEYTVKATIVINGKSIQLYKVIEVYPVPILNNPENFVQCDIDNSGYSFFNLFEIRNNIVSPWPNEDHELYFYLNYNDALLGINEVTDPDYFQNTISPQQIFVNIINPEGCAAISNFYIEVQSQNLGFIEPMLSCEPSDNVINNGEGRFNLAEKTQQLISQFNVDENNDIYYYSSLEDALSNENRIQGTYVSSSRTLYAKITNNNGGCEGIGTFELIVNQPIILDIEDSYQMCDMQPNIILDGNYSNDSWQWSNNLGEILSNGREFEIFNAGQYQIEVTREENGIICTYLKQFEVLSPNIPEFEEVEIIGKNLLVSINGESSYEFSLDNQEFFGSGTYHTFYDVDPGIIDIYVRDINNCETPIQTQKSFVYYPKFFTPNGDNINDIWRVYGVSENLYNEVEIKIFDRYGKQLFTMNLNNQSDGWNGSFNNEQLPNSDYWFKVRLVDKDNIILEKIGHFSLKR